MCGKKFENPIAPKVPMKKIKSPWDIASTSYDSRCGQPAGDYYGVGMRAPVGKLRDGGESPIPQKSFREEP
jgi:hypothetical protein